MSFTTRTVSIQRNQPTDDNAGGVTDNWVMIKSELKCRRHLKRKESLFRDEHAGSGAGGAGVQTDTTPYFAFSKPWPSILTNDRIVEAGGMTYNVLYVREYDPNLQVDVENVT